jgi:hypothetical protein
MWEQAKTNSLSDKKVIAPIWLSALDHDGANSRLSGFWRHGDGYSAQTLS